MVDNFVNFVEKFKKELYLEGGKEENRYHFFFYPGMQI
jgi:hypothetical protein